LLRASGQICGRPLPICHIYANVQRNIFGRNKPDLVVSPALFTLDKLKNAGFFKEVQTKREIIGVDRCKNMSDKDYDITNILYVGNVSKHKGVHILVQAFTKIKSQSVRLHIVGKGKYLDELKRLCEGDSRINIYGFVSDEILDDLRQKSNIAVVPSIWYDMAQGAICESFSYGTPVIGSRIGGIPEYIDEGYNGLLFEPGNSEELKIILERLANNSQELKRLEEGALESSTRYNTEQHIDRLEIIFSDLIKKRMNI
jgi:glycosyltransferase involved in cell wall biosynthesis